MPRPRLSHFATGVQPDFEPLTEDELGFCWRSLVDQGQLSIPKLQKFMMDVCGEKLSPVQAKDLVSYMDANGDGRVGMEDFRNFMSIGRLADTDAKNFMWTPKAKYREEHGMDKEETVAYTSTVGLQATANMFSTMAADRDRSSASSSHVDPSRSGLATPPSILSAKAQAGAASSSAHPADSRSKKRGVRMPAGHQPGEDDAELSGKEAPAPVQKQKPQPASQKVLDKIEASLEKYERESWEKFLKEEEDFKKNLFNQFSYSEAGELSPTEYHKMLTKWHRLARWCMPGDLRPADSLAALDYVVRRDRATRGRAGAHSGGGETGGASGDAEGAAGHEVLASSEDKMSFRLWMDLINGKYRPDEHITASHTRRSTCDAARARATPDG